MEIFLNKDFKLQDFKIKSNNFYRLSSKLIIFGTVFSYCGQKIRLSNFSPKLKKIILKNSIENIQNALDGKFIIIRLKNNFLEIFTDKNGRQDLYYSKSKKGIIISDVIKKYFFQNEISKNYKKFDQFALACMLVNYGTYTPKKNTIYKNVKRLGIYECILYNFNTNSYLIKYLLRSREKIIDDKKIDLKDYHKLFQHSLKFRLSNSMNWIFMSSGWDSSSILAVLSKIVNYKKITAVIGQFRYCKKDGYCNLFEVEKAKAICEHFKVKLKIIKVDWLSKNFQKNFEKYKSQSKSNHLYATISYNFFRISEFIKKNSSSSDIVFNGDYSDGIHNFGHSQYATMLSYNDLGFREYVDKMHSYCFGPSFYKIAKKDKIFDDAVFKSILNLKNISNTNIVKKKYKNKEDFNFDFFGPLFLNNYRLPFTKIGNKIFKTRGENFFKSTLKENYFNTLININSDTIYDGILEIYNNFHWQSSTVRQLNLASEFFNVTGTSPFSDINFIRYVTTLSENYGRGLNLNPTKFPLKNMLKKYYNYPDYLQTGPHSYLYDVTPNWNVNREILFKTQARKILLNKKKVDNFISILDPKYFNIDYIKKNLNYFNNKQSEKTDLLLLINIMGIVNIGWYN
jgi:hypothetical protein